jgi:amino acid transporter
MKKDKGSFLESLASLLIILAFLAIFYHLISEWIQHVKNPKTRVKTLITSVIALILFFAIYNHLSVEQKPAQPSLYNTYK